MLYYIYEVTIMAKTKKSKQWAAVILDNYNDEYYEGVEEMLEQERKDQIAAGEDEDDVYVQDIDSYINESFDSQWSSLDDYELPRNVLACGNYESRYGFGSGAGGKVYIDLGIHSILEKLGKDCDYAKLGWKRKNGNLNFIGTHHDGTIYCELRELTDKGVELYQDWEYGNKLGDYSVQQIHEKLWNSPVYTKRIQFKSAY